MGFECGFSYVKKDSPIEDGKIIDYWCSIGRIFDDDVRNILDKKNDYLYTINKKNISALKNYVMKKLDQMDLVPVKIIDGIKDKKLLELDHLLIQFEDGTLRPLFLEEELFVSKNRAESDTIEAYKQLLECINKVEKLLSKYIVYYWRSY